MWVIDNTRIYVQEIPEDGKQTIARLQPLTGGTVYQTFGYENSSFKLTGVVVGTGVISQLRTKSRDGSTHTLSGAYGYYKSVYISGFSWKPRLIISQTIDMTQSCTSPVYDVNLELYEA
jgi:hypothetical protein